MRTKKVNAETQTQTIIAILYFMYTGMVHNCKQFRFGLTANPLSVDFDS